MNPAFSVILFTTLSGAGYGLLAWLGMTLALAPAGWLSADAELARCRLPVLLLPLLTGIVLTAIGLLSSTFHLGKPQRAWRAFSQWRTSWLSREGVLAILTYVPAVTMLMLLVLVWRSSAGSASLFDHAAAWLGGALAVLSLLTVACTAMIYASLQPVPAWRHRLVVPVYLGFALVTGFLVFAALTSMQAIDAMRGCVVAMQVHGATFAGVAAGVAALALMKFAYWRDLDRISLPSREAATALQGFGTVTTFERPHTEANYLTREMGFVLARKHGRKLRLIATLSFAGIPLLACIAADLLPATTSVSLWVAALAAVAGTFVERWLFFAEAKHMVTLYY